MCVFVCVLTDLRCFCPVFVPAQNQFAVGFLCAEFTLAALFCCRCGCLDLSVCMWVRVCMHACMFLASDLSKAVIQSLEHRPAQFKAVINLD